MAIDATTLRGLAGCAAAAHVIAAAGMLPAAGRTGRVLFRCGFALAAAAVLVRWVQVRHLPLQNLFEVFLCMAALCCPLSAFCRRCLRVPGGGEDALMAAVLLIPVVFVFDPTPRPLPPVLQSPLFGPHILSYLTGYLLMLKAGAQAVRVLRSKEAEGEPRRELEEGAHRLIRFGFPMLTLGLVLGSVWGKRAWGDYWNWDPKELWALAMWLTYVGYFQWRRMSGARHAVANAVVALAGCAVIVMTLLWVNLSRIFAGLHSYAA